MARSAIPPEVLERHLVFNRNSAGRWQSFAGHREKVTALLVERLTATPGRLCVLGAGNGNDLDLATLTAHAKAVHLVDLDEGAVRNGLERQGVAESERVVVHAPIDVMGLLPRLKAFAGQAGKPGADPAIAIDEATRAAREGTGALPGPFEVTVSACLLSQLMHSCRLALGPRHPALVDVAHAVVTAHLRALAALTAPGGSVVLVTDTASTETYPLVELWDAQPPQRLLEELERSDNVLSGTGPRYLRRVLTGDAPLRAGLTSVRVAEPWLWQLGDDVTLLAYAIVATRV